MKLCMPQCLGGQACIGCSGQAGTLPSHYTGSSDGASCPVTARAVTDNSASDSKSLPFKAGDIITVLEQQADGVWQGCVNQEGREVRTGLFPADKVLLGIRKPAANKQEETKPSSTYGPVPDLLTRGHTYSSNYMPSNHNSCSNYAENNFIGRNRGSLESSSTDAGHPPTSYSFPATPSSNFPHPSSNMHSSYPPRGPLNRDFSGVDSGFSSLHSVPQLTPSSPVVSQQIGKSPFAFGPTLSANDCVSYSLTSNRHGFKPEYHHIRHQPHDGEWATAPTSLPAQVGVGAEMRGSSPAKESPSHSNRNSAASSDSGRGCSTGHTDLKPAHNYVNVQVNPQQQQQHRLSDQSYESGVSSRQSYQSTSSSSHGSLDLVEEPGSQATINVTQLVQAGVPDNEVLNAWLHDLHFEEYFPLFVQAGYDLPTISRMTPEDLTAVGITKPAHRKRLKAEIARLSIPDGIPDFRPSDLMEWLHILGLGDYLDTLCGQGYDNIDYVTDITWEDLEEIGIRKLGHQKKIMLAIDRLKRIPPVVKHVSTVDGRTASLELLEPPPPAPPVTGRWSDGEGTALPSYVYEGAFTRARPMKSPSEDSMNTFVNENSGGSSDCGVRLSGGDGGCGSGEEMRLISLLHEDVGIAGAMPYHHGSSGCSFQPDLITLQVKKNTRSSTSDDRRDANGQQLMYQSFQGSPGRATDADSFLESSGSRSYNADSSGYTITSGSIVDRRTFKGKLLTRPDGEMHEPELNADVMKFGSNACPQKAGLSDSGLTLRMDTPVEHSDLTPKLDTGGEHIYDMPQISQSPKSPMPSMKPKPSSPFFASMAGPLHVATISDSSASGQGIPSPVGKMEKKIPPPPPIRTNSIRTECFSESTPSSPIKIPLASAGINISSAVHSQPTCIITPKQQPPPVMQKPQKPMSPSLTSKYIEHHNPKQQSSLAKSPNKVILPTSGLNPHSPTPSQGTLQMPVFTKSQVVAQQPKSPLPTKSAFPAIITSVPKQQQQFPQHQSFPQTSHKVHIVPTSQASHKAHIVPTSPASNKPHIVQSSASHKSHITPTSPASHKPHLVLTPQASHKTQIVPTSESMGTSQLPKGQSISLSPHHTAVSSAISVHHQQPHVQAFASCVKSLSEKFGKNTQNDDQFPDNASTDSDDFPPPPPPIAMDIITPKIHNYGIPSSRDRRRPEFGLHHQRDYAHKSRPTTVPSMNFSSITGVQLEHAKKNLTHNQAHHVHASVIIKTSHEPLTPTKTLHEPLAPTKTLHEPLSAIHLKKQPYLFSPTSQSPGRDTESMPEPDPVNTISKEKRSESTTSFESNSSSSSIDSNTLPFANENVGTIKQRTVNAKPAPQPIGMGTLQRNSDTSQNMFDVDLQRTPPGYSNSSSLSASYSQNNNSSVKGSSKNDVFSSDLQSQQQKYQHKPANLCSSTGILQPPVPNFKPPLSPKPSIAGLSSSSSSPSKSQQAESTISRNQEQTGNVLSDIDDMLQGLTDELDAMLEQEMAS